MKEYLRSLPLGIEIVRVDLEKRELPRQVKKAFDAVTNAGNKRKLFKSEAETYANETEQNAVVQAAKMRAEAVAYKARLKAKVESDATSMDLIFPDDGKVPNKAVLEKIYLEYITAALSNAKEAFYFEGEKDGQERFVRIQVGNLAKYRKKNKEEEKP